MIQLVDDGTLDSILVCTICNTRMRYNFDDEETYQAFVAWAIANAYDTHDCDEFEEGS